MSKQDPAFLDHQAWLGYLQPDGLVVSPAALHATATSSAKTSRPS